MSLLVIVFTIFWGIAIAGMLMNVVLLALRVPPAAPRSGSSPAPGYFLTDAHAR